MRWQTSAVLALILVALGGFYYVYEIRLGPERERAASRKGRLFTIEPADVSEVEIKRAEDVLRLKREGDGWQMLGPVNARGDRGAIEDVLTTVTTAKSDREIAAVPASPADFGLDKPSADIALTLKDGKRLGLKLGGKSPTGVWVYARENDKPNVFVVSEGVLRDASRPVADFRDKTILAFDRKDVSGLRIVLPDAALDVENSGGKWKLTRPVALAADGDAVLDFLDKLQVTKVKEFVAESPPSLEPFGLERPVRIMIHTGKDKERATKSLLIGRVDRGKKGVYALRPGETSVLLLAEEIWTMLPKNVAAVRNKTMVEFERDKVKGLEIESPRGTVTLVRDKDKWRITAPAALPADQVEVGGILFKLRELRAQAFLTDDASGIPRYLARPEVRVALAEEGASAPKVLLLAPSAERRGGQPSAYAAIAGQGPVVLVDAKALADIGRSLTDLRDRTLLGGLEPRDVKRIRVRSGGQSAFLERSGESEWRMLEPKKGSAKSARVEDLLYTLRSLKWKELVAPRGDEPAKYGLDTPTSEVTLSKSDGTDIGSVLFGKRDGDRIYVKTKALPAIYAIDAKQLGELPKVPDDFQG